MVGKRMAMDVPNSETLHADLNHFTVQSGRPSLVRRDGWHYLDDRTRARGQPLGPPTAPRLEALQAEHPDRIGHELSQMRRPF